MKNDLFAETWRIVNCKILEATILRCTYGDLPGEAFWGWLNFKSVGCDCGSVNTIAAPAASAMAFANSLLWTNVWLILKPPAGGSPNKNYYTWMANLNYKQSSSSSPLLQIFPKYSSVLIFHLKLFIFALLLHTNPSTEQRYRICTNSNCPL